MTQLRFQIQCVSVLLAGMLLSNAACSPGAGESDVSSARDAAAFEFVSDIHAKETTNWVLSNVIWPRCRDRNFLTRKTLSDAENEVCDQAQTQSDFESKFKQKFPELSVQIGSVLEGLGGAAAFIKAQQEKMPIGLATVMPLAAPGLLAFIAAQIAAGASAVAAFIAANAIPIVIALAAIGAIVYLIDRAVVVGPLLVELLETMAKFFVESRDTSLLLQAYELQTTIISELHVVFQAAGLSIIPFAASLMAFTQRAVTAYNTSPLVLSHTLPTTALEAQRRAEGLLAAKNIVKFTPVVAGQQTVFQQLLAGSASAAAPVFRSNVESVIAALAVHGVTVSRAPSTAQIRHITGLGARQGFEGAYQIELPTTCASAGCQSSALTIWIPDSGPLMAAQTLPAAFATVLRMDTGIALTVSTDPSGEVATDTLPSAEIAQALQQHASSVATSALAIQSATHQLTQSPPGAAAQPAPAPAQAAAPAVTNNYYTYIINGSSPPPGPDYCNRIGQVVGSVVPVALVGGALALARLRPMQCSTCREHLNIPALGAVTITALHMNRRLMSLFQNATAQTIGRAMHAWQIRQGAAVAACNPPGIDAWDAIETVLWGAGSYFILNLLWPDEGAGDDWTNSVCQGALQCVNPDEEDSEATGGEGDGAEAGPLVEYTQCADSTTCEDRCGEICYGALEDAYGDTAATAICQQACNEFTDPAAGTKNPHSLCASEASVAQACEGTLNSLGAWEAALGQRGWVSCGGGGSIAPSTSDCP